jgi:hypothetical protein
MCQTIKDLANGEIDPLKHPKFVLILEVNNKPRDSHKHDSNSNQYASSFNTIRGQGRHWRDSV